MTHTEIRRRLHRLAGPAFLCMAAIAGCHSGQARFATPEEAAGALVSAVRSDNEVEVKRILGRGAEDIVSSGDEVADRERREMFLAAYDEKNSLVAESDREVTLQVGANDWPLPIPIVQGRGAWRFDTAAGKEEILNRRIGNNELAVIQVCLAVVDAQKEYIAGDPDGDGVHEYAQKFVSDPGQKNGLFWPTGEGEPMSPLGLLAADAAAEGYTPSQTPQPFHGYRYRMLTAQGKDAAGGSRDYLVGGNMTGGFAVVAWPAEYGNSGVMTFLVNQQGVVYQRDLGRRTAQIAEAMTSFDPDSRWEMESPED